MRLSVQRPWWSEWSWKVLGECASHSSYRGDKEAYMHVNACGQWPPSNFREKVRDSEAENSEA